MVFLNVIRYVSFQGFWQENPLPIENIINIVNLSGSFLEIPSTALFAIKSLDIYYVMGFPENKISKLKGEQV